MKKAVKIFVLCDALGYDLVRSYGFLADVLPYQYPLAMQFGYSSTAIPTILCGEAPQKHGHFSFFYYARDGRSPFRMFRWLHPFLHPAVIFNNHRVRRRLSAWLARHHGFTGYFNLYSLPYARLPYFDYCEKEDIFAPGGLAPCHNVADVFAASGLQCHLSDWRRGDTFNMQEAARLLEKGESDILFVYTAAIDGMLHFNLQRPDVVRETLAAYQQRLEQILDAARRRYAEVDCYLFSDHGMTPLAGTADLRAAVEQTGLRFGEDYVACYDSTMLRLWILRPDARQQLLDAMAQAPGHWLTIQEKQEWGIDFPDAKFGEEIFLLNPGMQIAPSDMGDKAIPGMHGYTPEDRYSTASFLSLRDVAEPPRRLTDIMRLLRQEIRALGGQA